MTAAKQSVASVAIWPAANIRLGRGIRLGSEQDHEPNDRSPSWRRTGATGQFLTFDPPDWVAASSPKPKFIETQHQTDCGHHE
ncbi:hypothetical protein LC605_32110 [Nostoc sp. CHAB 5836]|nr:hypothetical protein [Nostoc sp. CHAB 5836]